jgi:hypothetical protein
VSIDDTKRRKVSGSIQSDTPSLGRLKIIARWISGDPLMLPMGAGTLPIMASEVLGVAYEYLNLAFLLDANGVYFGARSLRAHHAALLRVMAAMGELDRARRTRWRSRCLADRDRQGCPCRPRDSLRP